MICGTCIYKGRNDFVCQPAKMMKVAMGYGCASPSAVFSLIGRQFFWDHTDVEIRKLVKIFNSCASQRASEHRAVLEQILEEGMK